MSPLSLGGEAAVLQPLWLPVALALSILAFVARRPRRADGWHRVLSPDVLAFLGGAEAKPAHRSRFARPDLVLLAAALLALALAAPATRRSADETWRQSTGWIALADVSRSMTLDDTVPSRLAALRGTLLALSARAGARPLALILYAGDAFLVAPAAFDRRLVEEQAALLEHGIVPIEGSNLARALSLAASVASDSAFARARVLVLGDSGGSGKASEAAARHLADRGHRVDLVLFGSDGEIAATGRPDEDSSIEDDSGGTLDSGSTDGPGSVDADAVASRRDDSVEPPPPGELADITQATGTGPAGARLAVDVAASGRLARAGGGRVVRSDAFGVVPLDALDLGDDDDPERTAGLESVLWHDVSHWLLLGVVPVLLLAFRRGED